MKSTSPWLVNVPKPQPRDWPKGSTCPWLVKLVLLVLFAGGCGGAARSPWPEGVPRPTTLGPQLPSGTVTIGEARCIGGGLGGCPGWHLPR
jgi:hypothetical protein